MKSVQVKLREKRQLTLPAEVCAELGVRVGDLIEISIDEGQAILRAGRLAALDALEELRRALAESGVTEEELLETGREVRKEIFRETYPDLARKYGI